MQMGLIMLSDRNPKDKGDELVHHFMELASQLQQASGRKFSATRVTEMNNIIDRLSNQLDNIEDYFVGY